MQQSFRDKTQYFYLATRLCHGCSCAVTNFYARDESIKKRRPHKLLVSDKIPRRDTARSVAGKKNFEASELSECQVYQSASRVETNRLSYSKLFFNVPSNSRAIGK